jgi:hypothetical protein
MATTTNSNQIMLFIKNSAANDQKYYTVVLHCSQGEPDCQTPVDSALRGITNALPDYHPLNSISSSFTSILWFVPSTYDFGAEVQILSQRDVPFQQLCKILFLRKATLKFPHSIGAKYGLRRESAVPLIDQVHFSCC